MNEISKSRYLDLEERREFYRQKLGSPTNIDIYNYYINMVGVAIEHRSKDADFNRLQFPYSIGAKQEMIKVIMIIMADTRAAMEKEVAGQLHQAPVPTLPTKKKLFARWRKK